MKKKILSLLVVGVMALNLTGCAMFESEINDIKGNLVGNGYTIDTFDNYGKRVMTTTGDKINIQGNPVETLLMIVMEVLLQVMNYLLLLLLLLMGKKLNLVEILVSLHKKV